MEITVSYLLMLQFKPKDFETKDYTLCLGNISKYFRISDMTKNRIKSKCKIFFC